MRTTITIDDALLAQAKQWAAAGHRSVSDVVDDSLRNLFARRAVAAGGPRRPIPTDGDPHGRPLVDINDREALAEVLGDNTWPRADS